MRPNQISVIIIFHGRRGHLLNVLKSLECGQEIPEEIILVEMDSVNSVLPELNLDIKHVLISDFDPSNLPIAQARNIGATLANFDTLVFLDVDCIPSFNYIVDIRNFEIDSHSLYMCKPLYLLEAVTNVQTFEFTNDAVEHPLRPQYRTTIQTQDYGLFWSLCFFIPNSLFFEIGGFDDHYRGYGAEDTDFSYNCRNHKIPLYLTNHRVYHQQHSFMRPPLNAIKSIVKNSNYFYSKWFSWPMINHLEKFEEMKYIKWSENDDKHIEIVNLPNEIIIDQSVVSDERYA